MSDHNPFEAHLDKNPGNYAALSPLTFIERSAAVYPEHTAVIHGDLRFTWAETYGRCRRLAGALAGRGIGRGDAVAIMAPNTPANGILLLPTPSLNSVWMTTASST